MRKKLLIFYPFLASYRIGLCNRLAKDYEVKAVLTDKKQNLDGLGFDLNVVNSTAEFEYVYHNKGLYLGRHLISTIYYKYIKAFSPDVIWTHEFGIATLMAVLLKPFFKYEIFTTCDDSLDMAEAYDRTWKRWLRAFVIKRIHLLMLVSPKCKEHFEKTFQNNEGKFLYFPIIQDDTALSEQIDSAENEEKRIREEYKLQDKKVILLVARFDPVKNIPFLLEVYKEIAEDNNVLVLVGDGELRHEIQRNIEAFELQGKVIMTGALSGGALYAWYRLANIFVLPSKRECFGAVVNEALVAGCKCIVSDKAGAACLINSDNGQVFRSEDKADLTSKLQTILHDTVHPKIVRNLMPKDFESFYIDLFDHLKK